MEMGSAERMLAEVFVPGGYIAVWKLVIYTLFFGVWLWVGQWLDKDVQIARTKRSFWNNLFFGCGAVALVLWFVLPAPFLVTWMAFLIASGTVLVLYVMHRNARVNAEDRILTLSHVKSLISAEHRQKETKHRLVFVTQNRNELPVPHRQDDEYEGYVLAEDQLFELVTRRVSQAEFRPRKDQSQVTYVIDGMPGKAGEMDRREIDAMIAYLKAVAGLNVEDKRHPQQGRFRVGLEGKRIEWEIKTAGSTRGEQLQLNRIEKAADMTLDHLGFSDGQLESMRKLIAEPAGLVLVCGTHGMGLTTTMYSIIGEHDGFVQNIHSLETHPLADIDNVTQHVLDPKTEPMAAAKQLQSLLRKDPDVVMLGFCSCAEMAQLATQTVLDGKKVYTVMTAQGGFQALQNWMRLVDDAEKVAGSLLGITNQKLVRRLCPECREAYSPDGRMLQKLGLGSKARTFYRPPKEQQFDKHGNPIVCPTCQGTGYFGRTAIYETIFVTDSVRELIRENAPINDIRSQCRKEKTRYLQEQAIRKVIDGETSINEVLRVTTDPKKGDKGKLSSQTKG